LNEYKLFAYCFDYSVFPETVWTNIYDLPSSVVSAISFSGSQPSLSLNAYPNPATDFIRIEYELPTNIDNASLRLIDSNGRAVKNFQVDGHSDYLALNIDDLTKGVYFYFIEYNNIRTKSKKIVVQ
jgi:hypothetical protein